MTLVRTHPRSDSDLYTYHPDALDMMMLIV
jgi:hypothetical protein